MNSRMLAIGIALALAVAYAVVMPSQANDDDDDRGRGEQFVASLSGNEEVPYRDTRASGRAEFRLSSDASELHFKLKVTKIRNVFAAHIHCGTPGVNGDVGVTLLHPVTPGGGKVSGTIAKGVRTAPDAGNGCGWANLDAVLAAIRSGGAYVNVHTNDGVDPANTGPGDFPGGEIRGPVVSVSRDRGPTFQARLSGGNEVPARDTNARGQAHVWLSEDGTELHFRVTVRRISNVFMAHIHCGVAGANGPIGVTLYGMGPTNGGPISGLLVRAMKTAPDAGNTCGWTDLADVVEAIEAGGAYVNVHTNDGVTPADTGPGDFPGGEIRGQLRATHDD